MPKVTAYLDCGCAILENGSRTRCPTCEAALTAPPITALENALNLFRAEMLEKFWHRADKHGDHSVTIAGSKHLQEDGVYNDLWEHLEAEMQELRDADHTEDEMGEAVDVANMAFLIWWRDRGTP